MSVFKAYIAWVKMFYLSHEHFAPRASYALFTFIFDVLPGRHSLAHEGGIIRETAILVHLEISRPERYS